jgi:hypothetical protein
MRGCYRRRVQTVKFRLKFLKLGSSRLASSVSRQAVPKLNPGAGRVS